MSSMMDHPVSDWDSTPRLRKSENNRPSRIPSSATGGLLKANGMRGFEASGTFGNAGGAPGLLGQQGVHCNFGIPRGVGSGGGLGVIGMFFGRSS